MYIHCFDIRGAIFLSQTFMYLQLFYINVYIKVNSTFISHIIIFIKKNLTLPDVIYVVFIKLTAAYLSQTYKYIIIYLIKDSFLDIL